MVKGYKVGQVRSIKYNFADEKMPFVVEIAINDDVKLPLGTTLLLADEGLLGGKIIDIAFGGGTKFYGKGDTIVSDVSTGLLAALGEIMPKLENTLNNLDTTVNALKLIASSPSLHSGVNSFGKTMEDLNATLAQLKSATASLPQTMNNLNRISANLDTKLSELDLQKIIAELETTIGELNGFAQKLNNKDSSLGLLLNDKAVYNNLDQTIQSANALLVDLKANPKRYVNITVFGKKEKK
jgi:phospholipid/cholesterol/gamma-HCH transport system substrate-binding protein